VRQRSLGGGSGEAGAAPREPTRPKGGDKAGVLKKALLFWFGLTFPAHRLMRLCYLLLVLRLFGPYCWDYGEAFQGSPLAYTMRCSGCLQAIVASGTFTFLPRKKAAGYIDFGDHGSLSFNYILGNTCCAALLAFQQIYYDDRFSKPSFRRTPLLGLLFALLPYMPFIRPRWPVSSIGGSQNDEKGARKPQDNGLYRTSTLATKGFYIFAKHYIGSSLNYMRYLDWIGPREQRVMHGLLFGGGWGTTHAMFIHTLRFKGNISGRTAALAYQASIPWMIGCFGHLLSMMLEHLDGFATASVGLLLNNSFVTTNRRPVWHVYQLSVRLVMRRGVLHQLG